MDSRLQEALNNLRESSSDSDWHVHLDAHAINPKHKGEGDKATHAKIKSHLDDAGLGQHTHSIGSDSHDMKDLGMVVGGLSKEHAHKVLHSLGRKYTQATENYGNRSGTDLAVQAFKYEKKPGVEPDMAWGDDKSMSIHDRPSFR